MCVSVSVSVYVCVYVCVCDLASWNYNSVSVCMSISVCVSVKISAADALSVSVSACIYSAKEPTTFRKRVLYIPQKSPIYSAQERSCLRRCTKDTTALVQNVCARVCLRNVCIWWV